MSFINVPGVPSNQRVPLFYAAIGQTGAARLVDRSLIIGQKITAGTGSANTLYRVSSEAEAAELGGAGSMLHTAARAYFANDPGADLWLLIVADASGTAQVRTITVTAAGGATSAGAIALRVCGRLIVVDVASGASAADMAVAIAAAINAEYGLPVTAADSSNTVVVTARHHGVAAAGWGIALDADSQTALPGGTAVAASDTTAGATDPTLTTAIAALGDNPFSFIVNPYAGATPFGAVRAELARRWGATVQIYGQAFMGTRGTVSAAISAFATNDPNVSVLTLPAANTTPTWEIAAAYAGACAQSLRRHPAIPVHGTPLRGIQPTPASSGYTQAEQNSGGNNGIAVASRNAGEQFDRITIPATQYLTVAGQPQTVFWRVERRRTASMYVRRLRAAVENQYAQAILVEDAAVEGLAAGLKVASPSTVRATLIAEHEAMTRDGWVQSVEAFRESILVEIDGDVPGRINAQIEPRLADQLGIVAVNALFRDR
jgi:phage tail sheath gpL-like